jgi:hypothetical protein
MPRANLPPHLLPLGLLDVLRAIDEAINSCVAIEHRGTLVALAKVSEDIQFNLQGSTIGGLIFPDRIARPLSNYVSLDQYTNM